MVKCVTQACWANASAQNTKRNFSYDHICHCESRLAKFFEFCSPLLAPHSLTAHFRSLRSSVRSVRSAGPQSSSSASLQTFEPEPILFNTRAAWHTQNLTLGRVAHEQKVVRASKLEGLITKRAGHVRSSGWVCWPTCASHGSCPQSSGYYGLSFCVNSIWFYIWNVGHMFHLFYMHISLHIAAANTFPNKPKQRPKPPNHWRQHLGVLMSRTLLLSCQ